MKRLLFCAMLSFFISCSSSEEDITGENIDNDNEYALTAKIDGEDFLANSAFGDNNFSSTNIYNYYPLEDFVMLQAREDFSFAKEINIWLKRTDIVVGTYEITEEEFDSNTGNIISSHFIDYVDLTNSEIENTVGGTIVITDVNTSSKTVTGTFNLEVLATEYNVEPYTINITDGMFSYVYE